MATSWNILHDHNKVYGIGWTDNVTAQMTIHHNILRDTNQRNPSTDNVLRAHLYNNWLLRVESYGNYSRQATNMVIENSVFDQVNDPYYYDTGTLVVIGNITRNTTGRKESTGTSYSFFDPHKFYQYTQDAAGEVEALLTKCAGPRAESASNTNPSNNTILNCDPYENFDSQNGGENADGFAAKLELGPGNVFRGCRSWNNSDDGWDLFAAPSYL